MAAALGILLVCSPFSTHTPSRRLLLNPRGVRRFPTICIRSPSSSPHLPSEGTIDSPSSSSTTVQAAGDRFLDATTHAEERHGYKLASDSSGSPAVRVTPSAESTIEKLIFDFRFLALLAVGGSLGGSLLCFLNGCVYIVDAYKVYWTGCIKGVHTGKMVLRLVEAIDVYLAGTVMLIFAMGLYGLFISNSPPGLVPSLDRALKGSSLFGMFTLKERPKWMKISSLDELKTKVGHVIVMILLVKMFERSKMVAITTGMDLLSYSVCIFLSAASLYILHHLHKPE
ncbi:hypothetical protein KSP39_PZI001267 [Platanthera zijinensis]|uniref:Structural constituent of ribosome n=1 Tax=Platanthera zijinensis TaxID=2320716 RepID=A0AAP0C2C9_9ASPA